MPKNDDRTEQPTAKRKKESRRDGQLAKSPDISSWLIILVASFIIPTIVSVGEKRFVNLIEQSAIVMQSPTPQGAIHILQAGLTDMFDIVLPTVLVFMVTGVVANVAQTGPYLSLQAAKPKWSKINPISGFKHLFSAQSGYQLLKQLGKLLILVAVAYPSLMSLGHALVGTTPVDMSPVIAYSTSSILRLLRIVAGLGFLLGLGDYAIARRRLNKNLKMTKQEVKDEARNADGNPVIKRETRKKMYRLSRARMMAAVAGADVVVVNPTHYAVALRYEAGRGGAPRVVAKGADDVAMRIRDEGRKHKVPVIEDAPVARAIYAACDIDEFVPAELYLAVARLLAFVFTLPPIVRRAGLVHRRPNSAMVA